MSRFLYLWLSGMILCFSSFGQTIPDSFKWDKVPLINERVIYNVEFRYDYSNKEFHEKVSVYLNNDFKPYSGGFTKDNDNFSTGKVVDLLVVDSSVFQKFTMYMSYDIDFIYQDKRCTMTIHDISFMEKSYFEEVAGNQHGKEKRNIPKYSAEDIMIHKKYKLMLMRNASDKITKATTNRINSIVEGLSSSFKSENPMD